MGLFVSQFWDFFAQTVPFLGLFKNCHNFGTILLN
nr:MAG TPA: hypothetical protein [Caudoviricetes sp.]